MNKLLSSDVIGLERVKPSVVVGSQLREKSVSHVVTAVERYRVNGRSILELLGSFLLECEIGVFPFEPPLGDFLHDQRTTRVRFAIRQKVDSFHCYVPVCFLERNKFQITRGKISTMIKKPKFCFIN